MEIHHRERSHRVVQKEHRHKYNEYMVNKIGRNNAYSVHASFRVQGLHIRGSIQGIHRWCLDSYAFQRVRRYLRHCFHESRNQRIVNSSMILRNSVQIGWLITRCNDRFPNTVHGYLPLRLGIPQS